MSELVTCGECGTRYDSDRDAFCPRCGSTAKGEVVPAALQVARRNDPSRRRVQLAGAVLLVVGALFLASAVASAVVTARELPAEYADLMANQDGGTLVLTTDNGTAYDATVTTVRGAELANVKAATGETRVDLKGHAAAHVLVRVAGAAPANATVIVIAGDTLRLPVGDVGDGEVRASHSVGGINKVATAIAIAFSAVLAGGGLAAVLLRAWPLAATAAALGGLVGLFALFFFLVSGLLFAVPFGFAAAFILRGRRHFARKGE